MPLFKCKYCKKQKYSRSSKTKFCNHDCYAASRIGFPRNFSMFGENNPRWKGGRIFDKDGYIMVYSPKHPDRNAIGYVREHRLKMEKKLGRRIAKHEVVHHKNCIRHDNRLKNLEIMTKREHDELTRNSPTFKKNLSYAQKLKTSG